MSGARAQIATLFGRGGAPDRVVPRTGTTARLTVLSASAMAFLAVFALALAATAGRLATDWSQALGHSVTIRLSDADAAATVVAWLATTPGAGKARVLSTEETGALLEPWFGPDLPIEDLPMPTLIEVEDEGSLDIAALRLRLSSEAPDAVVDDHSRWRAPMVTAASRLRWLGALAALLIAGATGAIITLAANAALAANAQPIRVLRLIGARDDYIAQAFVRRFTRRAFLGAVIGTAAGIGAIELLPAGGGGVLPSFGFGGVGWLLPMAVPLVAAAVALMSARGAALRTLRTAT